MTATPLVALSLPVHTLKMATTGQWETVRKVNKKGKAPSQTQTKSQKKALVENMPKIETARKLSLEVFQL